MGQSIQYKINNSLKVTKSAPPIWRMLHITLAAIIPLSVGILNDQFGYSVFGALFALAITLNDHLGPIKQRIIHLITCSFFLNLGLLVGALFIPYKSYAPLFIFVAAFILGKIKDQGIELERMYLFSFFNFLAIFDSLTQKDQIYLPLIYSLIGFVSYLIFLIIIEYFSKNKTYTINSKRKMLKSSLENHTSNKFSFIYSTTVTISFYFFKSLHFKHSYWIAGTILIVMLPSFSQSFDKSFQRIFGTVLGVLIASILLTFNQNTYFIFMGIIATSFLIPWTINLNYWLANVCIAALVLFIAEAQHISTDIWAVSLERVIDISIGGFIAIFSNYFFLRK